MAKDSKKIKVSHFVQDLLQYIELFRRAILEGVCEYHGISRRYINKSARIQYITKRKGMDELEVELYSCEEHPAEALGLSWIPKYFICTNVCSTSTPVKAVEEYLLNKYGINESVHKLLCLK